MRTVLFALAFFLPLAAAGASYQGIVSHVTDGDTLWVRPLDGGPPKNIRIGGIDAPEVCQAFGAEARNALATHVLHRKVTVITKGEDDYRRTVARIHLGREDVGAWLVSRGYAWSYRFRRDMGPYAHEEARARSARRGLWNQSVSELPRNFRVRHGPCH